MLTANSYRQLTCMITSPTITPANKLQSTPTDAPVLQRQKLFWVYLWLVWMPPCIRGLGQRGRLFVTARWQPVKPRGPCPKMLRLPTSDFLVFVSLDCS